MIHRVQREHLGPTYQHYMDFGQWVQCKQGLRQRTCTISSVIIWRGLCTFLCVPNQGFSKVKVIALFCCSFSHHIFYALKTETMKKESYVHLRAYIGINIFMVCLLSFQTFSFPFIAHGFYQNIAVQKSVLLKARKIHNWILLSSLLCLHKTINRKEQKVLSIDVGFYHLSSADYRALAMKDKPTTEYKSNIIFFTGFFCLFGWLVVFRMCISSCTSS